MKITLTIEGLPPVAFETWQAGALSHTKGRAPLDPVTLSLEHSEAELILGQIEAFVLGSVGFGAKFPSTVAAERQRDELSSLYGDAKKGQEAAQDSAARWHRRSDEEAERHKLWFKRAVEAADLVLSLRERIAGRGIRWPKGFRERVAAVETWSPADESESKS